MKILISIGVFFKCAYASTCIFLENCDGDFYFGSFYRNIILSLLSNNNTNYYYYTKVIIDVKSVEHMKVERLNMIFL